jgi:hypothetical protein
MTAMGPAKYITSSSQTATVGVDMPLMTSMIQTAVSSQTMSTNNNHAATKRVVTI